MAEAKEAGSKAGTMTRENFVKSQADYKGKEHSDLVEVEIIANGKYVRKGTKRRVHPTMAKLLKEKGLIEGEGKPYERPKFEQKDVVVDA